MSDNQVQVASSAAETPVPITPHLQPGLFTESTERDSTNRYKDGDKVRFFKGRPRKMGGWLAQALTGETLRGVPRSTKEWLSNDRQKFIAFGTHNKLYLINQLQLYDITPLRRQVTLTNPFTTANGTPTVTVTDAAHGAVVGNYVRYSGATAVGGLAITGEYKIQTVTGIDTYTITASSNASSSVTGGGTVVAQYDITSGTEYGGLYGYGVGTYGTSTYGTARATTTITRGIRIWSLDTWGEDLLASPTDDAVYYWDRTTGPNSRAVLVPTAPATNKRIIVSPAGRQLICLGAHNGTEQDPLLIRVSNNEDFTDFEADPDGGDNVFEKRIDVGTSIITGFRTRTSVLVHTDKSVHIMQPDIDNVYDVRLLSEGNSIIGPNAGIEINGTLYWMGSRKFIMYDGIIQEIECDVTTKVFDDFNYNFTDKVCCRHISKFSEIWWHYTSTGGSENDRYVVYNYVEKHWTFGTIDRTCGFDPGVGVNSTFGLPYAFRSTGTLYRHETGVDDGAGVAMSAYLESYDIQIGDGRKQMHVSKAIPDFKSIVGTFNLTLKSKKRPEDSAYTSKGPYAFTSATTAKGVRARGRQMAVRFDSSAVSADWDLAPFTYYIQEDSER